MNELMRKLFMEQLYQIYLNNGVKDVEKTEESLALNINKLAVPFDNYLDKNGNPKHFIPLPVKELQFKIVFPDGSIITNTKLVRVSFRSRGEERICCRCEVLIFRNMEERKDGLYAVKHEKDFLLTELQRKLPNFPSEEQAFEALRPYAVSITVSHALTKLGIGLGIDSVEEDMDLATSATATEKDDFVPVDEMLDTKTETPVVDFTEAFDESETEASATPVIAEEVKAEIEPSETAETKPEEKQKKRGRKPKKDTEAVVVEEQVTPTPATDSEPTEEADLTGNTNDTVSEEVVAEEVISDMDVEEIVTEEAPVEETVAVDAVDEPITEEEVSSVPVEEEVTEQPAETITTSAVFPTDDGVQTSFDIDGNIDTKEAGTVDEEEVDDMTLEEAKNHIVEIGKYTKEEVIPTLGQIAERDPMHYKYLYLKAFHRHSKRGQVALRVIIENNEEIRNFIENN